MIEGELFPLCGRLMVRFTQLETIRMMLKRLPFGALLGAVALLAQGPVQPGKTHLKIGDTAPDFELNSSQGKKIKLSDYRGKKTVVLAFFPAAFTGG